MLTVIFSTYNGVDTLPIMLDSLTKVTFPSEGWKLIAIDNASTDNTRVILDSYLERLPLTILTELKPGKNNALNTGLKYIEGDLVVFTDDDVIVDVSWLVNLLDQAKLNTEFNIFAGQILPYWTVMPEQWVLEWVNHQVVYALTPIDLKEGEIPSGMVWGANMAVRAEVFNKGFLFDTNVGPDGTNSYKMGSETSFTATLEKQGYRSYYAPNAKVQHIITQNQLQYEWILGRAVRSGKSQLNTKNSIDFNTSLWWNIPRYMYREYLLNLINLWIAHVRIDKKEVFLRRWTLNITRGLMQEAKIFYKQ
ncbi:glycosyltransferase family 2 protein [Crenothrix sp.]|uniref:glycosyltransferase family 2 protein n=1 Tax=Crenothrix sp. TaxID=3100433 RepID=UPI00374D1C1F